MPTWSGLQGAGATEAARAPHGGGGRGVQPGLHGAELPRRELQRLPEQRAGRAVRQLHERVDLTGGRCH